jgi:multidrug efflux pump subunit AcrA (membrane-fusion protein)
MKKKVIVTSCVVAGVLLVGGIAFGVSRYQYSKNVVEVIPVESLNSDWWSDDEGSSGTVTNSMSQEVVPDDDNTVKKIYVKEGDTVKIGDKLVAYDMAQKKLELELKGYDVQEIELSITKAETELANLKKGVVSGSGTSTSDNSVGRKDPLLASLFLRATGFLRSSEDTAQVETQSETSESETTTTSSETTTASTEAAATTTQKATATTEAPDDEREANVYSTLTSSSVAYKGKGTSKSPYRYLCTSDCKIKGSFINMIRGYSADGSKKTGSSIVVILEVRKDNTTWGSLINSLTLYGADETKKNPSSSWSLDSYVSGQEDDDTVATTATDSTGDDSDNDDGDSYISDGGSSGSDGTGGSIDVSTYTKAELQEMITEKENDLSDLKLDLKEAQLEYDTLKKEVDDGTVTAVINGIVKEVNDPDDAASDGTSVVTISSEGNLYVKGQVDEFSYQDLKAGDTITATSWETGNVFEAKITEVSQYPSSSSSYYSSGSTNPNVSYYPFTAVIEEEPEDISSGESVTISFNQSQQSDEDEETIYLPLAYVRTDDGQSYVYLQGEDGKLQKQYVKTGQTLYNYVIQIKGGLKVTDSIAFPYGSSVKEGAKTKIADEDADIY